MFFIGILLSLLVQGVLIPVESNTASVSGYWTGEITQDEGGYRNVYVLEMLLKESNGKVSGKSFVNVDDIYAEMQISGRFSNGLVLTIKDEGINKSRIKPGMEWCLKSYILLLKKENNEFILEGHWHGSTSFSTCTPGKVFLKKGIFRV